MAHQLQEATRVLKVEMPRNGVQPNTSTYNTIIAMFCHHLQEERAEEFLRDLESSPFCKPDVQTYFPLLKLYFKVGKTDEFLKKLVNDIVNKHQVLTYQVMHFFSMVYAEQINVNGRILYLRIWSAKRLLLDTRHAVFCCRKLNKRICMRLPIRSNCS
ncbi:hypothetical protein RDI58_013048 [Solanum bulbocastanum]|uniref:Pentatricopeptide repeat-containing protein n=1 Tax=Solanum bulbocastanum TaxID=147425 RepID=A0AAN8YDM4_SOLBU